MFSESTTIVLILYFTQGLTALVVMLILRKFYKSYKNDYFKYWYWSWLALVVLMLSSAIALSNAFLLEQNHPFRIAISALSIAAALTQYFWLFAGSYELSLAKKFHKKRFLLFTALAIPVSLILVISFMGDPNGAAMRIFLRVGVKSIIGAISFIASAIMIYRLRHVGIGMKVIFVSFMLYGLEQLNYFFIHISSFLDFLQAFSLPYYIGIFDLFTQSLMGMGMILSMLELERAHLKKANNELDMFLYRSSHDLRAPLTTISGIVNVMKGVDSREKSEEYMNAIQERVLQADNAIRDIITLRKGQMTDLVVKEVDLKDEVKREYEFLTNPSLPSLRLVLNSTNNTRIHTDIARLHTVLENILSNSIKYHDYEKDDPRIEVLIEKAETGLNLKISDNGPGIDAKHLPKIFDMFYRANKSSIGTGLGLYLVKDALDHMKGSIGVESQKGKGTTFDIFLRDLK